MAHTPTVDVPIAGAGPVGLSAAALSAHLTALSAIDVVHFIDDHH
ncbi:hypothetical protein U5640_01645 [Streptomyces sp. SS7]